MPQWTHFANLQCKHKDAKQAMSEHSLSVLAEMHASMVPVAGVWEETDMSISVSLCIGPSDAFQRSTHYGVKVE